MQFRTLVILIVCIAAVAAAGCTSLQGSSAGSTVAPAPAESQKASYDYSSGPALAVSGPISPPVPVPTSGGEPGQGVETKIIRTADLSLEVSNVTGAAARSGRSAPTPGDTYRPRISGPTIPAQPTGTVVLRIPADQFDSALSGVKSIGTVKSISTQGQDVTAEYVDVQARITLYQNQIAQDNAIMKNATDVEDVLAIQQQIDTVQTSLDRSPAR